MVHAPAACPVSTITRQICGRWEARLNRAVFRKDSRTLEAAGLIARREHPGAAAHSDDHLTERGRTLAPVMRAVAGWGLAPPAGAPDTVPGARADHEARA